MPTREGVLQGLSAPSQIPSADNQCAICYEPFADPVQVPCHFGHVFCRECITGWFQSPEHNTCPTDRTELFEPGWEDGSDDNANDNLDHTGPINSRLAQYQLMVKTIDYIDIVKDTAPDDASRAEMTGALHTIRDAFLSAETFTQGDTTEYVFRLHNVKSEFYQTLSVLRPIADRPREYKEIDFLLQLEITMVQHFMNHAAHSVP